MGKIKDLQKVRLFTGVMYSEGFDPGEAMDLMIGRFGGIEQYSPEFDFYFTSYYENEMGRGLKKRFLTFSHLIDRQELPGIKVFTNGIEERFSVEKDGELKRRVNIDPGYITPSNVVLATTKEFPHRIYLDQGIFGEVTFTFRKDGLEYYHWTYDDYKTELTEKFFISARRKYLEDLR